MVMTSEETSWLDGSYFILISELAIDKENLSIIYTVLLRKEKSPRVNTCTGWGPVVEM